MGDSGAGPLLGGRAIHSVPSAQEQLDFIQKLRRLLDEGGFVATYKYALLHAIADLCVTLGDDSGGPLTLSTRELADQFIRLYWRQAAPFPSGDLEDIQEGRCFYCRGKLRDAAAVDHFVPWRRYPLDLAHNFVLAHGSCNSSKADRLAAVHHLRRWHQRNLDQQYELPRRFEEAGLVHDVRASARITRWAYQQVASQGGQVWVKGKTLVRLEEGWEGVLRGGAAGGGG